MRSVFLKAPFRIGVLAAGVLLGGMAAFLRGHSLASPASVRLVDVTAQSGIDFRHQSGAFGKKYMPETVGSGLAFLDYNGDSHLDILYVNSCPWPEARKPGDTTRSALYRNNGDGTFTDTTEAAGLGPELYGMGVAAGDYNNDGHTDLYLTALGPNRLLQNRGDGTFKDITREAGVAGAPQQPGGLRWKWSSSASWLDYDRDGNLDLLVLNYVKWTPEDDVWCGVPRQKVYCPPSAYEATVNTLYRNLGNGRFKDVTQETGLNAATGKGFGVATDDFDGDGWIDVAVANDTVPNLVFFNRGGKRFEEKGFESGVAVSDAGRPKAGMGIDCADWSNEGRSGLLVGNFSREGLSLFRNSGGGRFEDVAFRAGLGASSQLFLTFGAFFFDYDNDGWKDALAANGHIDDLINVSDAAITYEQRPLIYHNLRNGRFEEVGDRVNPVSAHRMVARGAAWGDYDSDGDPDVGLVWNNKKGLLWRNDGGSRNHWLGLQLQGTRSNRDGIGAVVRVTAGGFTRTATRKSGGSFLSESDPRLLFGLGRADKADVEVRWPSGEVTRLRAVGAGRYYRVVEGEAAAEPLGVRK